MGWWALDSDEPCPRCGDDIRWGEPESPRAPATIVDVVLAATATAVILPFIQAIATKAGEDAYEAIRRLIQRRPNHKRNDDADGEGEQTGYDDEQVRWWSEALLSSPPCRLIDDSSHVALSLPPEIPDEAARALGDFNLKLRSNVWIELSWDDDTMAWVIRRRDLSG
jgi:hypothetical protein